MFTLITAKMIQFDNLTIIFSNELLPPPTRILCWRWISKKNVFGIWTKIEEPKKIWTILKSLSQLPTLTFVFGKYIGGIFGSTRTVKLTTSLVLKMDGWKMIHVLLGVRPIFRCNMLECTSSVFLALIFQRLPPPSKAYNLRWPIPEDLFVCPENGLYLQSYFGDGLRPLILLQGGVSILRVSADDADVFTLASWVQNQNMFMIFIVVLLIQKSGDHVTIPLFTGF